MPKKAPRTIASKPKPKAGAASPSRKSAETAKPDKPKKAKHAGKRLPSPLRSHFCTQKLADEICRRLAEGESLRSIARTPGFPSESRIREWSLDATRPFCAQYARARAAGYHKLADELLEIADDAERDIIEREDGSLAVDHKTCSARGFASIHENGFCRRCCRRSMATSSKSAVTAGEPLTFKLIPGDEKL